MPPKSARDRIHEATIIRFIVAIENGEYDKYLERILSAAHDRKRALRGERLFPK